MTKLKLTALSVFAFVTTFLIVVILTPYEDQRPLFYFVALTIALTISFLFYFPVFPIAKPGFDAGIAELGIVIAFGFVITPFPFAALYFVLNGSDHWVYVIELAWIFLWAAYYVYASISLKFIANIAKKEEARNWAKETVAKIDMLSLSAPDKSTRDMISRLSDEINYSNTRSTASSESIEAQIDNAIENLKNSLGDPEVAKEVILSSLALVKQRQIILSNP